VAEVLSVEHLRDHDPIFCLTRTFWNCSFLVDIDVLLSPSAGSPNEWVDYGSAFGIAITDVSSFCERCSVSVTISFFLEQILPQQACGSNASPCTFVVCLVLKLSGESLLQTARQQITFDSKHLGAHYSRKSIHLSGILLNLSSDE